MTSIDDVIQPGQPIPDDVTEVEDRTEHDHERGPDGRWYMGGADAGDPNPWGDDELMDFAPLTVTAVREQPAEPERRLRGCVENWPEAETGSYDPRCCRFPKSCSATVYDEDAVTEEQLEPAEPEPQQADASPVLDLVRQFGDARFDEGREGTAEASTAGREAFDRIAALVPQQPVQARSREGALLWQHVCLSVVGISRTPMVPGPCADCGERDSSWLPLLVGGDPAPEQPNLIAQVMAELDLTDPADVLITIAKRAAAFKRVCASADLRKEQRDEARAEVESLKVRLNFVLGELAGYQDAPAQPDPLVLSLPEVPEDVRRTTNQRWIKVGVPGVWDSGWIEASDLADGPLTIELAPPREPRTWPKLDAPPDDLRKVEVRQPDGTQFVAARRKDGHWAAVIAHFNPENAELDETYTWSELLGEGDVTEVTE